MVSNNGEVVADQKDSERVCITHTGHRPCLGPEGAEISAAASEDRRPSGPTKPWDNAWFQSRSAIPCDLQKGTRNQTVRFLRLCVWATSKVKLGTACRETEEAMDPRHRSAGRGAPPPPLAPCWRASRRFVRRVDQPFLLVSLLRQLPHRGSEVNRQNEAAAAQQRQPCTGGKKIRNRERHAELQCMRSLGTNCSRLPLPFPTVKTSLVPWFPKLGFSSFSFLFGLAFGEPPPVPRQHGFKTNRTCCASR